ncbi:MAG: ABC transporter permease, partial [bacterium]
MSDYEIEARRQESKTNWLLCTPALIILFVAASGPLFVMLLYSFLTPGDYGGVEYKASTEGWFKVFLNRDIFDDTVTLADAHLSILW